MAASTAWCAPAFSLAVLCGADFEYCRQFDQLGLVLVGVVLAEQQFPARGEFGAHSGCRPASIAAIRPGEFRNGQRCVHGLLRKVLSAPTAGTAVAYLYCVRRLSGRLCSRGFERLCRVSRAAVLRVVHSGLMDRHPEFLVHLCGSGEWDSAKRAGELCPQSLTEVGFIHLSTPQQVHLPANRLFPGRTDVLLLHLDPDRLGSPVLWEPGVVGDPESMVFPHLYGPLPLDAVTGVVRYSADAAGKFPQYRASPVP